MGAKTATKVFKIIKINKLFETKLNQRPQAQSQITKQLFGCCKIIGVFRKIPLFCGLAICLKIQVIPNLWP
jgi:hypothetical protein